MIIPKMILEMVSFERILKIKKSYDRIDCHLILERCFCFFFVREMFLLWHLRWKWFYLFLRFITTRGIECQKGSPHPPL